MPFPLPILTISTDCSKLVLKIPLLLAHIGLGFLNANLRLTGDPPRCFLFILKIENKKAATWNIRVYTAIKFHLI